MHQDCLLLCISFKHGNAVVCGSLSTLKTLVFYEPFRLSVSLGDNELVSRNLVVLGLVGFVTSFGAHSVAVNLPTYAKEVGVGTLTIGLLIAGL